MTQTVGEVMTSDPVTIDAGATVADAAQAMRDNDIGALIVRDGGGVCGVLTDRDITVRAVAERRNPEAVRVRDVCTRDVTTIAPDEPVDEVVQRMRALGIRRMPVVENGSAVGIVALGDVAVARDEGSALGEISAAPPNR